MTLILVVAFQNCGMEGFSAQKASGSISLESSDPLTIVAEGAVYSPVQPLPLSPNAKPEPSYGNKIIVTDEVARLITASLNDLKATLKVMDGDDRVVIGAPTPSGIHLLLTNDPHADPKMKRLLENQGIEPFIIRGNSQRLEILANTEDGLRLGISYYLFKLGCRWLLPNEDFAEIPRRTHVNLNENLLVRPRFKIRTIYGTGGYFSNALGRAFNDSAVMQTDFEKWQRRLGMGGEYRSGGHMGEAFISENWETLQSYPHYFASRNGTRDKLFVPMANGPFRVIPATGKYEKVKPPETGTHQLNTIIKYDVTNPAMIKLWTDWIVKKMTLYRKLPSKILHNVISTEPSDGKGWSEGLPNLPGNGSPSDQVFYLVNETAKAVRAAFPESSVIALAYHDHADPPSFPLEKNVIVQVTPNAFRNGTPHYYLNESEFIELWRKKQAARMAMYDYWQIPDWSNDDPNFNYLNLDTRLSELRQKGIEAFQAESTFSAGAMGITQFIASRLLWHEEDVNSIKEEFYELGFGPAKAPMKRMLERWATSYLPISRELALSYADLNEARTLAGGHPKYLRRIADYAIYVHYLRLRNEFQYEAFAPFERRLTLLREKFKFMFSTHSRRMFHTTRHFDLFAFRRGYPELKDDFNLPGSLHNPTGPEGPLWREVHRYTAAQALSLIDSGRAKYPSSGFDLREFKGPLVRLNTSTILADEWSPIFPTIGNLKAHVFVPEHESSIRFKVSTNRTNHIVIRDSANKVAATAEILPVSSVGLKEYSIPVPPGQYRIEFYPDGSRATGTFSVQFHRKNPVSLFDFLSPKPNPSPRLYFFVPRGTSKIVIHYPLQVPGAYGVNGTGPEIYSSDGQRVTTLIKDGGFIVEAGVPAGQDGKVWSINKSIAPAEAVRMLTTPQTFALDPYSLLVPADSL